MQNVLERYPDNIKNKHNNIVAFRDKKVAEATCNSIKEEVNRILEQQKLEK